MKGHYYCSSTASASARGVSDQGAPCRCGGGAPPPPPGCGADAMGLFREGFGRQASWRECSPSGSEWRRGCPVHRSPASRPLRASSRPLKGAGGVWRLARIAVHEGRERIFGEFITGNRVWGCTPGQCIDGESPRGGGADGEGGGGDGSPRPCLDVSLKTSLAGSPPPPGRSAASSRPLKGAGSAWR